ncbi:hypothetical protein ACFLZ6_01650 [Nanoarchaeota archaeon]
MVLLLVILGGFLFLAAQILIHKTGKRIKEERRRVWVWRSFLLVLVIYLVAIMYSNRGLISEIFPGPLSIIPTIILTIFFGAMLEIVIIDMLLPDVVDMWKRITMELLGFLLICFISFYTFNAGLNLLAALV